jgi:pimeloyl-ACP methyl ester carboxylesterase
MNNTLHRFLTLGAVCGAVLQLSAQATSTDSIQVRQESVQFVTVGENVRLEVVDWGGTGRPLIFLAGLGNNAHSYAALIAKLVPDYHVFSLTRRGFPPSSISESAEAYSSDRLGDDVVAVIDALKIFHPVLVGHSIAGEELSSVGSRHPEKISGLVYLDAGYGYALYDRVNGDWQVSMNEANRELAQLPQARLSGDPTLVINQLLETLPQLEKALANQKQIQVLVADLAPYIPQARQHPPRHHNAPVDPTVMVIPAIIAGEQAYTDIRVPILALFAFPHALGDTFKDDPKRRAELQEVERLNAGGQIEAFKRQLPTARVICLPNATHLIMTSNETDVLREMNAFVNGLPAIGAQGLGNGAEKQDLEAAKKTSPGEKVALTEPAAEPETMYLRGSMNSWGKTAMSLVDADTWKVTVSLPAHTTENLKFDAWGDWTHGANWGGAGVGAIGTAGPDGGNLTFTTGEGTSYTITFNEHTLRYSVEAAQ